MTTYLTIPTHAGFEGFVSGVVNASYRQRAHFEFWVGGERRKSATFEGQGDRVNMKDVLNDMEHWSFGPINQSGEIRVRITHLVGSDERSSKMAGPLTIRKVSESDYPVEFYKNTVISEDYADQSHDDCTFLVLEYK